MSLASVANRAVESFTDAAREKGVVLTSQVDGVRAIVSGDAERRQQIANNLLANAVKFMPPGGTVEVSVTPRLTS